MTAEACRDWRERLGAYVLDQLPDDERAAVRAHLDGCAACRAEADSLAPLAGLLPMVDPDHLDAPAPTPPPQLADRVARSIAAARRGGRRRRRMRISLALSGAAAAVAAAVAALVLVSSPGGEDREAQRVAFRSLPPGVDVGATLEPRSFGTQIHMRVAGFSSGTLCRVFLRRADGTRVPAGSFHYRYSGGDVEEAVLTSALDLSNAKAVGLRAGRRVFVAPLPGAVGSADDANDQSTTEEAKT
jgi:hypothetical protein